MGEGSGSFAKGSAPVTRPPAVSAWNAPPVGTVMVDRHDRYSPSTCLATMLRWISFDPP